MIVFSVSTGNKLGLGLIALAFIVFALVSAMAIPRRRPDFPRNVGGFVTLTACFFAATLFAIFFFGKESHAGNEALGEAGTTTVEGAPPQKPGVTATTTGTSAPGADLVAGKKVFETAGCADCHTLKDAGASGTVGPNLDQVQPSETLVETQVTNGGPIMPAFRGKLSPSQIQNVAAYVANVAGKA